MPLFERDRLYCVNGLLFNPMTSAGLADTLSGTAWHERLGVYAGRGEEIPEDVLRAKCSKCKGSTYGASNPVSVYHFTAPFDGVIKGFTLFLRSHLRETASRAELNMEFIAERMSGSTGSEIFRKSIQVVREGTATLEEELPVAVRVPIKKGAKYQLSLKLTRDPGISGGSTATMWITVNSMSSIPPSLPPATHGPFPRKGGPAGRWRWCATGRRRKLPQSCPPSVGRR